MKLFPLMALNALVIYGVNTATAPGEVLEPIGRALDSPDWIRKPTVGCEPCMASIWGTAMYFLFGPRDFILWPFYILALSGLMRFVVRYGR